MIVQPATHRGFSLIELVFVLAVGTILLAAATPLVRGAIREHHIEAGGTSVANALREARREALRTSARIRVEAEPATGRVSVFAFSDAAGSVVEKRRLYLPDTVVFTNPASGTATLTFDPMGRPTALPMTVQIRSETTGETRTITVLSTGRVNVT